MFLRRLNFNSIQKCKNIYTVTRNFQNLTEDIPEVSPSLIRKTLKTLNISYQEGHACFITECPICELNAKPTASTLYVNKITGLFMCSKCNHSGDWNILELCFPKNGNKREPFKWKDIEMNLIKANEYIKDIQFTTKHITTLNDETYDNVLTNLKLPKVSKNLLKPLDIRIDCENKLYFPLENADMKIVGYKVLGDELITLPDVKCGGILRGSKTRYKDVAVLVENISDFLVLYTSTLNSSIICLPNGIKSFPQYCLPAFERYKRIILWFDNEMQSWNAARNFGKKLGERRCLCVRPSNKHVLPHHDHSQDFKSIVNNAHNLWHKSITTFSSLRQDVLSDLQNFDQTQGVKWKRFPTLNKLLKGHRSGELTVITGPTGSGKTTFISEYSLDLAMQGVNTLWGSFEIRNVRLAKIMLQQMVGKPLDTNVNLFDKWADKFEKLPLYYMTFHGQQSIKIVMEAVEHAAYIHDINHVIIDNVQFMMGISEESRHMDRFWKQDSIIAAFRTFATKKNCHVTLVIHPRKERIDEELTTSSIFGGAKASQEADNVLLIQDKRLTGPRGRKYLQIAKNRYSGDLGVMPLDFDKDALSYASKKKKKMEETHIESSQTVDSEQKS